MAFDKRRVTMTSYTTRQDEGGQPFTETHEAVDHVPVDMLDA